MLIFCLFLGQYLHHYFVKLNFLFIILNKVFLLIWLHFFFAIWFYSLDFAIWFLQSDLISAAKTFSWDTIKSDISRLEKMLRYQGENHK